MASRAMKAMLIAWVLWQGRTVVAGVIQPTEWQPLQGFDTLAECGEMKNAQHKRLTASPFYPYGSGTRVIDTKDKVALSSKSESGEEKVVLVEFRCLPETVDPPAPK